MIIFALVLPDLGVSRMERSILDIMRHLQHLRPGIFTSAEYSICKLLSSSRIATTDDSDLLDCVASIILMEPDGSLKWLSKVRSD